MNPLLPIEEKKSDAVKILDHKTCPDGGGGIWITGLGDDGRMYKWLYKTGCWHLMKEATGKPVKAPVRKRR